MPQRIEITLTENLVDAEGEALRHKAKNYFDIDIETVRTIQIVTIDADLADAHVETARSEIFTNPVTQVSALTPLAVDFDWIIWIGFRPGVRDNPGATAVEAVEDLLHVKLAPGQAIYISRRYCLKGATITRQDAEKIAGEILANDIIQQWAVYDRSQWDPETGIGFVIPKVILDHTPEVTTLAIDSDATLARLSDERSLSLNPSDIPTIRAYFLDPAVQRQRQAVSLGDPTDVELEYISQGRSDHCNHNTFGGRFYYRDLSTGESETIESLFKTYIEAPTLALQKKKPWVVSVLWDNAGVGRFDDDNCYTITGETHNSPSNMEAYGGAITGIVGIYRDPMGTGKGSRLIMGSYGYCVGPRDYAGDLKPKLHPKRLLDGVIEGVRDGGNKSGIPTPFGQVMFHPGYLGKCLVFVTALGIMPATVDGAPSDRKTIYPGDLAIMCGGRVGKDGIHGVTASSATFSANTPAGHVQIGDPYTQKKMHDFLLEARDEGLIRFITDNGGGGLSSSVGESARFSGGCEIQLEKVPLKYDGLDQWEIWVSESQERMTVAIDPRHLDRFMALSRLHAVESTVIGTYTDSGKLHITYNGVTCAYVDLDLLTSAFPKWEFEAVWQPPERRGLSEPVLGTPIDMAGLILDLLARPNICSKAWVTRQYDHEVQGSSVIKPLVGAGQDIPTDAAVIRPVLASQRGLVFSQALIPMYSAIDAYHMTTCTIDEAVRRAIAVGGDPGHLGGVDNFCWPNIQYDPKTNPDGRHKAAQLVRACKALERMCLAYGIPLLSGKDSMYVDGHLPGRYGETHKVSALETLQFSVTGVIDDVRQCITLDSKLAGDRVWIVGMTRDELGGSEYYDHLGKIGVNVPTVDPEAFAEVYRRMADAIRQGLLASCHGVYRGGLAVHLGLVAMAGELGMTVDLAKVPAGDALRDDTLLFSESAGRFIVTVAPDHQDAFAALFADRPAACVGEVTQAPELAITGTDGKNLATLSVDAMKAAWKRPFGDLI
ncbi:phosphoribosylformylglycinamidine synthase subunit PurL [Desulfosarcina ovata subsp. sediminis]|uniref:Phosphoribosylformylglycinamidine synthase subunit PurL n=1 Tax=Desulfosarcina ovata subsp. sediminis TaxID=885957 RepID=A0A5K8A2W6_9BACT|nr:AIR synthase-related protein [Desulfosarcina ovata]BBO86650.1 phosphoribosylformylglycinamidine synthase subunit PurL [Desulfosarcina ovata subsp. sediminis]